ncbi:GRM6 protein, partial [Cardinalis cardinalis]|nr:GRM6 protein [Cardinalis cardinalis]
AGGLCIAQSIKIPREPKPGEFAKVIGRLMETSTARGVVLFANEDDIRASQCAPVHTSTHQSCPSPSPALLSPPEFLPVQSGPLPVAPQSNPVASQSFTVPPSFDEYFTSRSLENNRRNLWFHEFWEDDFNCRL